MNDAENAVKAAEQKQSAEQFIATIAPLTAKSGQIDILREVGRITKQDSLLEVWCGAGDLTAQLAEISGRVVGADHSVKLINAAKERFADVEFVLSETINLPFPENQFDVVVSNFVAHHYSFPEKNFAEVHRVLKPGGRFVVAIPVQSKRTGFNIILNTAREFLDLPEKVIKGGPLLDAESPEEIIDVLRVAEFEMFEGFVRTNFTVVESIDTLLNYAWNKIELGTAGPEIQEQIRVKSIEEMRLYRQSDGSYRFPDEVLAVRGEKAPA